MKQPYRVFIEDDITLCSQKEFEPKEVSSLLTLVRECQKKTPANSSSLGGRGAIVYGTVPSIGEVVVKGYSRGGFLRRFIERSYLRIGSTRSQLEFETLTQVRELGVNAPQPIAFAHAGSVVYRAWLIMKRIEGERSFADISRQDEDLLRSLSSLLVSQLAILIRNKIFHVDLHPGNVLVDKTGKVFLLDFDKAIPFRGRPNALRDHYLRRWRRAVLKHDLPDIVSEGVCAGLRENFENDL